MTRGWGNNSDKDSLDMKLYTSNMQNFYVIAISIKKSLEIKHE